jgi:hypothetical protein
MYTKKRLRIFALSLGLATGAPKWASVFLSSLCVSGKVNNSNVLNGLPRAKLTGSFPVPFAIIEIES